MPRYIDAELIDLTKYKIGRSLATDWIDVEDVKRAIALTPTADVAPKREVEELIRENESLAKNVNEASELIRKLKGKVEEAKTEVERLQAELDDKQFRCDSCDRIMLTGAEHRACVKQAKAEVAREIFAEIYALCDNAEEKLDILFTKTNDYRKGYENSVKHFRGNMDTIKKKYTEEVT